MDSHTTSPFDALIFDLDDTLYSSTIGFGEATKRNIDAFLVERCGFSDEKASAVRVELFKTYGSTLAGLRAIGYDIDADDYHSFVHGRLPYDRIQPDLRLRNILLSINQRKIIFTNSDRIHATKVLNGLGIKDCFEQIICFETMNPSLFDPKSKPDCPKELPVVLKPSLDAFNIAIDAAEVDPRRTLFFDDSVRNIAAGKVVGLQTVLVGKTSKTKEADYAIEVIHNITEAVPEIRFTGKEKEKGNNNNNNNRMKISRSRSELDSIPTATIVGA